jgi:hypothetical protein
MLDINDLRKENDHHEDEVRQKLNAIIAESALKITQ